MAIKKRILQLFKLQRIKFFSYSVIVAIALVVILQAVLLGFFICKTNKLQNKLVELEKEQKQNFALLTNILNQQRTTLWNIRGDIMNIK